METTYVVLKYKTDVWGYEDALDHANELANDTSGVVEDAVEDDSFEEAHLITLAIEEDDLDSLRTGLYELLTGLGGVQFVIEADEDE